MEIRIENAVKEDAVQIARTVAAALGEDSEKLAEGIYEGDWQKWSKIFENLAAREDSQYSYLNTLKAVTPDGDIAGMIVSYDGGRLHELREAFFEELYNVAGIRLSEVHDETEPGEWYLDSLAVWPAYRNQGIASMLIDAAAERGRKAGLAPGLLVDKENDRARRLYELLGFKYKEERYFMNTLMDHYRKE